MPIAILYIGYEPKTLDFLIKNKKNKIVAVAKMDILSPKTINPFNLLFFLLYFLRQNNFKSKFFLEFFLYAICFVNQFFTTGVFKRYKKYILNLSKNKIKVWDLFDDTCVDKIKENIDLIIVNIWNLIDKKIFTAPRFGSVNIHPSKLPKNIGAIPTLWTLKNNDKESAVSYVFIHEKGIDSGGIIKQENFLIEKDDDIIKIENKVINIISNTINVVIQNIIESKFTLIQQDDTQISKTEKYEIYKEIKPTEEISKDILNKVKGYPYVIYGEYCFIYFKNKKIFLKNINKKGNYRWSFVIECKDGVKLYAKYFFDVNIVDSIFIILNKLKK